MERFVRGGLVYGGGTAKTGPRPYQSIDSASIRGADYQPGMRVVSLDIETAYDKERLVALVKNGGREA